jgi:hypothetical protein
MSGWKLKSLNSVWHASTQLSELRNRTGAFAIQTLHRDRKSRLEAAARQYLRQVGHVQMDITRGAWAMCWGVTKK